MPTRGASREWRVGDDVEIHDDGVWQLGRVTKVAESGLVEVQFAKANGQLETAGVEEKHRGTMLRLPTSNSPTTRRRMTRDTAEEAVEAPNSAGRSARRARKSKSTTGKKQLRGEERKRLVWAALDAYVKRKVIGGVLIDTKDKAAALVNPEWTHHFIDRDWKVYVAEKHGEAQHAPQNERDGDGDAEGGDEEDDLEDGDDEDEAVEFEQDDELQLMYDPVCERDARAAKSAAALCAEQRASRGRPLLIKPFLEKRDTRLAKLRATLAWAEQAKKSQHERTSTISECINAARSEFSNSLPFSSSCISRLAGNYNRTGKLPKAPGAPAALPLPIETLIKDTCVEMGDHYCGLEQEQVCLLASVFIQDHPWLPRLFKDGTPGSKWFAGFRQRWGDVLRLKLWDARETRRAKWATYANFAMW